MTNDMTEPKPHGLLFDQNQNPPKFLYKYRHLEGKHRERTKRIITHSEIYFASRTKFNDPFDCDFYLEQEELEKIAESICNKNKRLLKESIEKELLEQGFDKPEKYQQIQEDTQQALDGYRILCLVKENDNILLWSHYADKHKGLCLKFRMIPLLMGWIPYRVIYENKYPKSKISEPDEKLFQFTRTKSKQWKYEKEWRIIDAERGPALIEFRKEMLVGIIFGCKMPKKDKEEINECVKQHNPKIKLEQAEKVPGEYSLRIKPYKP